MSKGRKGVIILAVAILAVVIVIGAIASKLGLSGASADLERQLVEAKRDGLALSAEELRGPEIRSEDNAEFLILNQAQAIKDIPGDPVGTLSLWGVTYAMKPTTDDKAAKVLADLKPVIENAIEASLRPHLDFHYRWDEGSRLEMPGLPVVKQLVKVLVWQARLDRLSGRTDASLVSLQAASRLANQLSETPCVIAVLVQIACEAIAEREAADLLRQDPSPKTLAGVRKVLDDFGPMPNFRKALRGDFVIFLSDAPRLGYRTDDVRAGAADDTNHPAEWKLMRLKTVLALNESVAIRDFRRIWDAAPSEEVNYASCLEKFSAAELAMSGEAPLSAMASSAYCPYGAGVLDAWTRCLTRRRVLNAAIDILQVRSKTEELPASWQLPGREGVDPFTDKPLAYRRSGSGFVVYSYDKDRQDDGGRPYTLDDGKYRQDISFEYPKLTVRPFVTPKVSASKAVGD